MPLKQRESYLAESTSGGETRDPHRYGVMIVLVSAGSLPFSTVVVLLLPLVHDLVLLVILVAEGLVIAGRGLLLLVGAYISHIVDEVRVVDRAW